MVETPRLQAKQIRRDGYPLHSHGPQMLWFPLEFSPGDCGLVSQPDSYQNRYEAPNTPYATHTHLRSSPNIRVSRANQPREAVPTCQVPSNSLPDHRPSTRASRCNRHPGKLAVCKRVTLEGQSLLKPRPQQRMRSGLTKISSASEKQRTTLETCMVPPFAHPSLASSSQHCCGRRYKD
jgi:hypothetical protein